MIDQNAAVHFGVEKKDAALKDSRSQDLEMLNTMAVRDGVFVYRFCTIPATIKKGKK